MPQLTLSCFCHSTHMIISWFHCHPVMWCIIMGLHQERWVCFLHFYYIWMELSFSLMISFIEADSMSVWRSKYSERYMSPVDAQDSMDPYHGYSSVVVMSGDYKSCKDRFPANCQWCCLPLPCQNLMATAWVQLVPQTNSICWTAIDALKSIGKSISFASVNVIGRMSFAKDGWMILTNGMAQSSVFHLSALASVSRHQNLVNTQWHWLREMRKHLLKTMPKCSKRAIWDKEGISRKLKDT